MYCSIASAIFAIRNWNKASDGDVGRGVVAAAQTTGVIQEVGKFNLGRVATIASNNVNPLICASSVFKTAMSDDKVKTGITEAAALSAMFAGEGLTKLHYEKFVKSKEFRNVLAKAAKSKVLKPIFKFVNNHKLHGKVGEVMKALTFITASIGSYALGHKYGDELSDRVKANLNIKTPKKIDQKA